MADADEQPDDEVLARLAAGKDERAFTMLFDRYYERVRAYAYRATLDAAAADDVAQETFIRVARRLETLRDGQAFRAWAFRIATHLLHDEGRRQSARRYLEVNLVVAQEPARENGRADERRVALHAALGDLPPAQREAVALVYFDDFSHGEAARVLGCAESTVSWRIFLAKRRLKQVLSRS